MKNVVALLFLLLGGMSFSHAQKQNTSVPERCGSTLDLEKLHKYNPEAYQRVMQIESDIQKNLQENKGPNGTQLVNDPQTIITIPVVVHVLHNGEAVNTGTNISLAKIQSQIDVLNEDFRRNNADASNTPSSFVGVATDSRIEFRLACRDPNGSPTDGVVRVQVPNNGTNNFQVFNNPDGTTNDNATGIKPNSPS